MLNAENDSVDIDSSTVPLLASGGRDRLIHIYDVNRLGILLTVLLHSSIVRTTGFWLLTSFSLSFAVVPQSR